MAGVHPRRGQRRAAGPAARPDLARRAPAERFGSFNLIHRNAILEMEPPDHTRLRRLISAAFARGHVERLRPWVEELAGRLVDGLVERSAGSEPVDLLSGMAEQLPVAVIAELLGVPEADRPLLRPWSNAIVKMYEYGRTAAASRTPPSARPTSSSPTCAALAAERRRPRATTCVSHLVSVRDAEGDRLTEDELVTTCILLLNAGHEATVNVSGNGTARAAAPPRPAGAAARRPGRCCRPRSRSSCASTRRCSCSSAPPPRTSRSAGSRSQPGQKVAALLGSANHDPAVFAGPTARRRPRRQPAHLLRRRRALLHRGAAGAGGAAGAFGALLDRTSSLELGGEPVAPSGVRHPRPGRAARRPHGLR